MVPRFVDEPLLIDSLLGLVLGAAPARPGQPGGAGAGATGASPSDGDPVHGRTVASAAVRLRALGLLARSVGAASRFPGTIQAIFHSVFGSDATPELQLAGLQLGYWTVRRRAPDWGLPFGLLFWILLFWPPIEPPIGPLIGPPIEPLIAPRTQVLDWAL